jgi:purine-binding chemotaxis protein CheW
MNEGNKFSLNIYNHYVVFRLDERQFALNLHSVERVVRAVAVTSLPKAPEIVLGVINVHGQIIPVLDIRKLFRLPEKRINLNDQFILVKTRSRTIAILANEVSSVVERSEQEVITEKDMLPDIEHIEGAIKLEDGAISMIIMQDFDKFFALERAPTPDSAIQENVG